MLLRLASVGPLRSIMDNVGNGIREYHSLLAMVWPRVELLLPAHKLICIYRDRIESFRD